MQILTSAATNQFIDVPAVFLRVLTASCIDSLLRETNCEETGSEVHAARDAHTLAHSQVQTSNI